ncbi:hypothetical protein GGI12_004527 [Dipsacomyces acuminosporus]|nr:hypothetical protein GGI12_004527 [Dipsacomyces acuminosporus]
MNDNNKILHSRDVQLSTEVRLQLIETLFGIKADPVGKADTATITACCVVFSLTLPLIIYAWVNRKYYPIRAKRLTMTTMMYACGVLWFFGNIPVNGLVDITGPWTQCKVWTIWFRILFNYVYSSILFVRFYALDRVFNQNKPFRGRVVYICTGAVVASHLAFCVVGQLVSDKLTAGYSGFVQVCYITDAFRYASIGLQWVVWFGVAVLMFRLRNIQSSFNEFRESLVIFILAVILLLETTIVLSVHPKYPLVRSQRISKTLFDTVISNMIVWVILAQPVYKCVFHRDEYQTEWLQKLVKGGNRVFCDFTTNIPGPNSASVSKHEDMINVNMNHNLINYMLFQSRANRHIEGSTTLADQSMAYLPSLNLGQDSEYGMDAFGNIQSLSNISSTNNSNPSMPLTNQSPERPQSDRLIL